MRRFGWVWMAVVVACGGGGGAAGDAADAMARDAPADAITLPFLEAYDKAWEEPDAAARRRLLEYSAVEGLIVYEPTRTLGSREAVYTAMTDFVTSYPGGSVPLVGNVREMHERVWLRWDVLTGNGTSLAMGSI